jgi:hypothetical protein
MLCDIIRNEDDTSMKVLGKYFSKQPFFLLTKTFNWTNTTYMEFYREIPIG